MESEILDELLEHYILHGLIDLEPEGIKPHEDLRIETIRSQGPVFPTPRMVIQRDSKPFRYEKLSKSISPLWSSFEEAEEAEKIRQCLPFRALTKPQVNEPF